MPVGGGGSLGQAGLVASTTGCLVRRIESPVRPVVAARPVVGLVVVSICSMRPGSVP